MKTLIIDTETTGLPHHPAAKDEIQPRIIEFAGLLVDEIGTELDEFETLINPGQPLEEIITKITGLTDDDLKAAPTFKEVAPQIAAIFAKADCLLGHNLPFDFGLVRGEVERNGIKDWPWPQHRICTVQETAPYYGYRAKLVDWYRDVMGEEFPQKHRAMSDVKALKAVAKKAGVLM